MMLFSSSPVTATNESIWSRLSSCSSSRSVPSPCRIKRVGQHLGQPFGTVQVLLDDLDARRGSHRFGDKTAHAAAAHDHDVVHARPLALAGEAKEGGGVGRITDGKQVIARQQAVVALGDDRDVVAIDGHQLQRRIVVTPAEFGQGHADQRRVFLQNQADQFDAPVLQVHDVRGAALLQQPHDGGGGLTLGLDQVIDAQVLGRQREIRLRILRVAQPGDRHGDAHRFGQPARHQVDAVVVGYGAKHVGPFDAGLAQHLQAAAAIPR